MEFGALREELFGSPEGADQLLAFLEHGGFDGLLFWNLEDPDDAWVSPGFAAMLGYQSDEIDRPATWWRRRVVREDLAPTIEAVERTAADPSVPFDRVVRYHHRDGRVISVRARGVALHHDEQGVPVRFLGLHTDVTEMAETQEALTRVNDVLRQFASTIGHDLRNPLAAASGLLGLVQQQAESGSLSADQLAQLVDRAVGALARADRMVVDLVDFARKAATDPDLVPVALDDVVAEAVLAVRLVPHGRRATIEVDASLPRVWGSPTALRHVLQNLLDNACKYAPPGDAAHVVVAATRRDGVVELTVSDDGIGIEPAEREAVFDLGTRAEEADEVADGTGVGLAAARVLLAQLGGTIQAEAGPDGTGTTMRLRLQPVVRRPDDPVEPGDGQ